MLHYNTENHKTISYQGLLVSSRLVQNDKNICLHIWAHLRHIHEYMQCKVLYVHWLWLLVTCLCLPTTETTYVKNFQNQHRYWVHKLGLSRLNLNFGGSCRHHGRKHWTDISRPRVIINNTHIIYHTHIHCIYMNINPDTVARQFTGEQVVIIIITPWGRVLTTWVCFIL